MLRPLLLMILATALWGSSNVGQKLALEHLGPFAIVAVRCGLGALTILPLVLRELRGGHALTGLLRSSDAWLTAVSFCLAFMLQQIAAAGTSATNLGFLVNICVVMTPLMVWVLDRQPPGWRLMVAALLACFGASFLSGASTAPLAWGDAVCVASAAVYAIWIIAVGRSVGRGTGPGLLTFAQLVFTGLASGLVSLVLEDTRTEHLAAVAPELIFLGVFGTGAGFALSAYAQRSLPICVAAVVMSLEAVFGALGGYWLLGESLTPLALFGGGLMLVGIVLAQVGGSSAQPSTQEEAQEEEEPAWQGDAEPSAAE